MNARTAPSYVPTGLDDLARPARRGDWSQIGHAADGTPRQFYPLDPRSEEVFIEDIALSLSRQARYLGHTRSDEDPLSVAQHSVLVSFRVEEVLNQTVCSRHVISAACSQSYPTHIMQPPTERPSWWTDQQSEWQTRQERAWDQARRYRVQLLCTKCAGQFSDATDKEAPLGLGHVSIRQLTPALKRELRLWGLLHDAAEAYLGDLPRPIKHMPELQSILQPYRDAEKRVQNAICERFGLPLAEPPIVKEADTLLLTTEARDLMAPLHPDWTHKPENGFAIGPDEIFPVGWRAARHMFLQRFNELVAEPTT